MAVEVKEFYDEELVYSTITDKEKFLTTWRVSVSDSGYFFWVISVDKGELADCLKSTYTKQVDAEKAVIKYLEDKPKSVSMRRKQNREAMEKSRAEQSKSKADPSL